MVSHSRRAFLRKSFQTAGAAALGGGAPAVFGARKPKPPLWNVLFIGVDDLRPDLGCYGNTRVHTPNIDRLAADGLTFTRAYCQQAVCSPSRTSLMTGRRPDSTRVYDLETHFRRYLPGARTLPEHFRRAGYASTAFGKVFHKPRLDDFPSWSIPSWMPDSEPWNSEANNSSARERWNELRAAHWISREDVYYDPAKRRPRSPGSGWDMPSWESRDVADQSLPDGQIADAAIAALNPLRNQRFFIGAGFLKPHLPFVAPKKYYDLYPADKIDLTENTEWPHSVPLFALHDSDELRGYSDIPGEGPITEKKARELIRGYYASISYVDAQIGRLIDALDRRGLRENTVVVLWGDHGYHLGEHGLWNKHTNFEAATRSPLIVSVPGQRNAGRKTGALTEFVDIYPSLCELCGVSRPSGLEGSSFVPLIEDPERLWKRAVFSQYPREIPGVGPGMGRSMRTQRYRFTEWRAFDTNFLTSELYDYELDPHETRNVANRPSNISLVNGLSGMLNEGWRSSLPPIDGPV